MEEAFDIFGAASLEKRAVAASKQLEPSVRWQQPASASSCQAAASAQRCGPLAVNSLCVLKIRPGREVSTLEAGATTEPCPTRVPRCPRGAAAPRSPLGEMPALAQSEGPRSLSQSRRGEQDVLPADRHADAAPRRKGVGKRRAELRRGDLRAQLQPALG